MVEKGKGFQIFAHLLLIILVICCLAPFVLLLMSSFTEEESLIINGYSFFPKQFSTYAYDIRFCCHIIVLTGKSKDKLYRIYGRLLLSGEGKVL